MEAEKDASVSLGTEGTEREAALEPSPAKKSGPDLVRENAAEPEPPAREKAFEMEMEL